MTTNNEEYEALKKKALEQFRTGKSLLGKDGAFSPVGAKMYTGKREVKCRLVH